MIHSARSVRLLEADPELGDGLAGAERDAAHARLVVPQVEVEPGAWSTDEVRQAAESREPVLGVLVLAGVFTVEASLRGWGSAQLIGRGDVLFFDGYKTASIPLALSYEARTPLRLAVLDRRVVAAAQRWPHIIVGLCERAGGQAEQALMRQAVGQLPRVENRILGFLWSLADRWGQMETDGARIAQPFTHAELGRLVGARRPTVSLGIKQLVESGAVRVEDDGWIITRKSLTAFDPEEPPAGPSTPPPPAAQVASTESRSATEQRPTRLRVLTIATSLPAGDTMSRRDVADESAALAALDADVPDLVLVTCDGLDLDQPGMRLVTHLRRNRFRSARLILIRGAREAAPDALLAMAHDYIPGTLPDDQLVDRVQAQLAVAAARGRQRPVDQHAAPSAADGGGAHPPTS